MARTMVLDILKKELDSKVTLRGWVQRRRDLGGLIFIDIRDASGVVQVVFNQDHKTATEVADTLRSEYIIEVEGVVVKRDASTINENIQTGKLEVVAENLSVLSKADTPPFQIEDSEVSEDVRLKYRYVDLKRQKLQDTLRTRHRTTSAIREFLNAEYFTDIETPFLSKSTPEGARDYLVPSRIHHGEFYALPQSPQIYKQLLMLGGFERYYQIVKCFRDEDLRRDRQPEFTQVDIEKSFTSVEDMIETNERLLKYVFKEVKDLNIETPFKRLTYEDAMSKYGLDKPDTRFKMELTDLSDFSKNVGFKVFKSTVEQGGIVKAIVVKNNADKYSRKDIEALEEYVKLYGAKGLAWMKYDNEFTGPIAKFFDEEKQKELQEILGIENNDLVFFGADKASVVNAALGHLRNKLGEELDLIDQNQYNFVWITDWPLFEYDEEDDRYVAAHHPFTSPKEEDIKLLETEPEKVKANAYDIVLNGYELGGGSIRISDPGLQQKMFQALGFSNKQMNDQFGFLIEAFKYGAPPHGGIAYGLDRLIMLLTHTNNIRDVIAFPKTSSAQDLMMDSPSLVSNRQLNELHIQIKPEDKE